MKATPRPTPYIAATPRTDNNIGLVRYMLALAVFVAHFNLLTGHHLPFPLTSYQGVGGFFAISGFLIFKSFDRADGYIPGYLRNRAIRILPSYFFIVIATTLLSVFVSSAGASDYFMSGQTWRYLVANITFLNFLQPSLPGVFEGGVTDAVNGSLWTMKVEWTLYLSVPVVAWLIRRRRYSAWVIIATIYIVATIYRWGLWWLYSRTGTTIYEILSRQFLGQMTFFYAGALLYCYLDRLKPWLPTIGGLALIAVIAARIIGFDSPVYIFVIYPAALSAIVLTLGLWGHWGGFVARLEDCSYEIYLFHFPVIQTIWHIDSLASQPVWILFLITLAATWISAWLCARFVSSPIRRKLRGVKTACRQ